VSAAYFRATDGAPLAAEEALRTWATEAYTMLVETASKYGRVISAEQLAHAVQDATGVRSTERPHSWVGRVLTLVVYRCSATGEPPLTSLVVSPSTGTVGPAYSEVQRVAGQTALSDVAREKAAAQGRLDAYRRYAPDVPANAEPVLATKFIAAREQAKRTAKAAMPKRPVVLPPPDVPLTRICPQCFLETPIIGECQNCN
jgi:hypothetical protein